MTTHRAFVLRSRTKSNKTTTVIASTPNPDRYGDIVAGGEDWLTEAYMKNPVVQFSHRYDLPPVGKTERLTTDDDGNLIATIRWDDVPTNPLAQTVSAQFASGMMSAVSVGFQPTDSIERSKLPTDHPAHGDSGMYFTKNRLLEISAVPVPANGEALALRSVGLDQARSILNVEETDDTYIVTYAKYPSDDTDEEPEVEEEQFGDEDEDEDDEAGYDGDEDEDEEDRQPPTDEDEEPDDEDEEPAAEDDEDDEDEEDEEDEEAQSKALRQAVRQAVLELVGNDAQIRQALTASPRRQKDRKRSQGLVDLFGIDNQSLT